MRTSSFLPGSRIRLEVLSTQYSVLSTQYSVLSTQYSVLSTQYSVLSTQYSVLSTQYSVLSTQYSVLRSEEYTSELQSLAYLVCRLLLEKKKTKTMIII